jgi:predicted transcriptional regulator
MWSRLYITLGEDVMDNSRSSAQEERANAILGKVLGSLELEVMDFMWQTGQATVQQVTEAISRRGHKAYTTIMTVMVHLVGKGLLKRTKEGKRYRYQVAVDRQEFLKETAKSRLQALVSDFGDIAIAQFLEQIDNTDSTRLQQLRNLVHEASNDSNTPK